MLQLKGLVSLILMVWLLAIFNITAIAQEPAAQTNKDVAPVAKTDDVTTDNSETATESARQVRKRPEYTHYFTAQYAQRFDDNLLLRSTDKKSDLIYVPQLGFGLLRVRARSLMRIDYLGGAELHQRYSEFDGALHTLGANIEYDLSKRTSLFINEQFQQRPLTTGLGLFGEATTPGTTALTVLTPTRSLINDLSGGLTYRLNNRSNLTVSYNYTLSRFDNDQLIDTDEQRVALEYNRAINRVSSYAITYGVRFFSGKDSLMAHSLLPSYQYNHEKLRVRLGAGLELVDGDLNNRLFGTALAVLSYQLPNTTYSVNYNTGIGTGGGLASVTRNHTLFGAVTHRFTDRLSMEQRVGYSHVRNSLGLSSSPLLQTDLTSNEIVFEGRCNYQMTDKNSIFFSYLHSTQRLSKSSLGDVSRNSFSIGINFDTRRVRRSAGTVRNRS